ncbi:MAG: hypothetical protein II531_05320 [Bacteroidales bacterium]|nr:hypothetical protein [Bacteroidales bacterium]
MKNLSISVIAILTSILILFTGCEKDSLNDDTSNTSGNDPESNLPHVRITLSDSGPGFLQVKFEPVGEMAYFKCGKGRYPSSLKHTTPCNYRYGSLNPNREYNFSGISYDSAGRVIEETYVKFKTQQTPYADYMRDGDNFYPIAYADMRIETLANYHKKKCLRFVGTETGCWFQVAYISRAYEAVTKMWDEGTYYFSDNSNVPRYYAEYNMGTNSVKYIDDGKLVIQRSGDIFNIKVTDGENVVVVQFAGQLQ